MAIKYSNIKRRVEGDEEYAKGYRDAMHDISIALKDIAGCNKGVLRVLFGTHNIQEIICKGAKTILKAMGDYSANTKQEIKVGDEVVDDHEWQIVVTGFTTLAERGGPFKPCIIGMMLLGEGNDGPYCRAVMRPMNEVEKTGRRFKKLANAVNEALSALPAYETTVI